MLTYQQQRLLQRVRHAELDVVLHASGLEDIPYLQLEVGLLTRIDDLLADRYRASGYAQQQDAKNDHDRHLRPAHRYPHHRAIGRGAVYKDWAGGEK